MKLLKSLGTVAAALILAFGWKGLEMLKAGSHISESVMIVGMFVVAVLFLFQQVYLAFPKPVSRDSIESKRVFIEEYLSGFLSTYYQILTNRGVQDVPKVRACIMLPTKSKIPFRRRFLQIYFTACVSYDGYSGNEKAEKWYKGKGSCGFAWKLKQQQIFDEDDPKYKRPTETLSSQQLEVVGHIKSVISTPIFFDGEIVAVLNLDSEQPLTETKFLNTEVRREISKFTRDIASQFDKRGIMA